MKQPSEENLNKYRKAIDKMLEAVNYDIGMVLWSLTDLIHEDAKATIDENRQRKLSSIARKIELLAEDLDEMYN